MNDAREAGARPHRDADDDDEPVLPSVPEDERDEAWGDRSPSDERDVEWYRRQRPPHHG